MSRGSSASFLLTKPRPLSQLVRMPGTQRFARKNWPLCWAMTRVNRMSIGSVETKSVRPPRNVTFFKRLRDLRIASSVSSGSIIVWPEVWPSRLR